MSMRQSSIIKKTILFIVIGLFFGASAIPAIGNYTFSINSNYFHSVGIDDARKVATAKLIELDKTDFSIAGFTQISKDEWNLLYYVFELNPQGYIVVSGSYDLPPVIAYSFTSSLQDSKYPNPLSEILTADLTLRLENIQKLPKYLIQERHDSWDAYLLGTTRSSKSFEQWPPEGSTPTGGWLLANWHQSPPYNNLCPLDIYNGGGRSVAGCPAVAMAQILNFHNTTNDIVFDNGDDYYHNYAGNQYWIDNDYMTYDFPSFPQLNTYLTSLQNNYESQTPPTNTEKAALVFACGVAAHQVYSASISGTYGVNQALDAYERFGCSTVELLYKNDPDLYGRLAHNMMDALPAHLAVINSAGNMGHNIVVDGYNTNNYYHINWGWGGSYNGWYLIPDEIPYGLTVIEGLIVDILKPNTATPDISCEGTLDWTNVVPGNMVSGSFTVSNIGDAGSDLAWKITEWPTWGMWTFNPAYGHNLNPEDDPQTIDVNVIAPNQQNQEYTGYIKIVNIDDSSDYQLMPVSLDTSEGIQADLLCRGSLVCTGVNAGDVVNGNFTVENVGTAFSNLSWEVKSWPNWGTWTLTPNQGDNLTPEDGPVTIDVVVIAPDKKKTKFSGEIKIVNSENSSDYGIIPVSLTTPRISHSTIPDILWILMDRFMLVFPLLHLFMI
jgi:hypothetical protein